MSVGVKLSTHSFGQGVKFESNLILFCIYENFEILWKIQISKGFFFFFTQIAVAKYNSLRNIYYYLILFSKSLEHEILLNIILKQLKC